MLITAYVVHVRRTAMYRSRTVHGYNTDRILMWDYDYEDLKDLTFTYVGILSMSRCFTSVQLITLWMKYITIMKVMIVTVQ